MNFLVHQSNLLSGDGKTVCHCLKYEKRLTSGGEWAQTATEEDFLLVDIGHNDQNRLVPFATVGNLEKFCEAETIYIDRTFKASPQLFISSSQYMLCIMASTSITQSTASQHLVHIDSITFLNVLYQFPLRQLPTLSIPTLSTLTKWELTKWELTKWEVDQMGIDEVGIDKVGIDKVGRYHWTKL